MSAPLPPAATKYKFLGIGTASATAVMAIMAANPTFAFLTVGVLGAATKWFLKWFFSGFASMGLVLINTGVEAVHTMIDRGNFDGTMESVIAAVDAGHLTPKEGKALDDKVAHAHNEFGNLGGFQH